MKPFAEAFEQRGLWKRPRLGSRRFELRAGNDALAAVACRHRSRSRGLPR